MTISRMAAAAMAMLLSAGMAMAQVPQAAVSGTLPLRVYAEDHVHVGTPVQVLVSSHPSDAVLGWSTTSGDLCRDRECNWRPRGGTIPGDTSWMFWLPADTGTQTLTVTVTENGTETSRGVVSLTVLAAGAVGAPPSIRAVPATGIETGDIVSVTTTATDGQWGLSGGTWCRSSTCGFVSTGGPSGAAPYGTQAYWTATAAGSYRIHVATRNHQIAIVNLTVTEAAEEP